MSYISSQTPYKFGSLVPKTAKRDSSRKIQIVCNALDYLKEQRMIHEKDGGLLERLDIRNVCFENMTNETIDLSLYLVQREDFNYGYFVTNKESGEKKFVVNDGSYNIDTSRKSVILRPFESKVIGITSYVHFVRQMITVSNVDGRELLRNFEIYSNINHICVSKMTNGDAIIRSYFK